MSLSSPAPPVPENPSSVAATQQQYNTQAGIESQAGSNVNQQTPFGSLTYAQTGTGPNGVPLYTATTALSPEEQNLLRILQGTQATAGTQASNLISGANYGAQNPADVVGGMTSGTTKDLLDKEVSYLQPWQTMQRDQLDTKMRNQGLAPGNPAYDNSMAQLEKSFGNTVTGFLATAEPAAYQQATSSYMLPLTTAEQELGISQPQGPQFAPTPALNTQPANYTGAVANYNTAENTAYQSKLQQQQAMMSGLFGVPTAILGGWARSPSGGAAITSALGALV